MIAVSDAISARNHLILDLAGSIARGYVAVGRK